MKKILSTIVLGLFLISMANVAYAQSVTKDVIVGGQIFDEGYSTTISNVTIEIACNESVRKTISDSEGKYEVEFDNSNTTLCDIGHTVKVVAFKGNLSGTGEAIVKNSAMKINLVIINIPMTPEFGAILGLVTLLGSAGIFFFVVRKD